MIHRIIINYSFHKSGLKIPKLTDHQWVSMGCPKNHKDADIVMVPENSLHGVRCCRVQGEKCQSNFEIPGKNNKCHQMTYEDARELCMTVFNGSFRLCFPEELNDCCNSGCSSRFDDNTVWIGTLSKG